MLILAGNVIFPVQKLVFWREKLKDKGVCHLSWLGVFLPHSLLEEADIHMQLLR